MSHQQEIIFYSKDPISFRKYSDAISEKIPAKAKYKVYNLKLELKEWRTKARST